MDYLSIDWSIFLCYFQLIHLTWKPGIKSKQTLADDERSVSVVISLKLYGSPWSPAVYNSGTTKLHLYTYQLLIVCLFELHLYEYEYHFYNNNAFDTFKCLVTWSFFLLGKATIQARTIILEVARVLSAHKWRFAINVNFNGSTDSFFFQVNCISFYEDELW